MKKSELRQIIREEIKKLKEDTGQLVSDIENAIKKQFPKSFIMVKESKFAGKPVINIRFNLLPKDKWKGGEYTNPPLFVAGTIFIKDDIYEYTPKHSVLYTNPPEGKNLVYGSVKLPLRRKKGNSKQILSHITKQFAGIYKVVNDNKDNLKDDFGKEYII